LDILTELYKLLEKNIEMWKMSNSIYTRPKKIII
jgi:hypothetical protein